MLPAVLSRMGAVVSGGIKAPIRWTILRPTLSRIRYGSESNFVQVRVHVRCVCGRTAVVWRADVARGRSTGCSSRLCKARHEAAQLALAALRELSRGGRTVSVEDVAAWAQAYPARAREMDLAEVAE